MLPAEAANQATQTHSLHTSTAFSPTFPDQVTGSLLNPLTLSRVTETSCSGSVRADRR